MYGYFKQQSDVIELRKTWTWHRKGNLKRETEPLQTAAQNNAIRANFIKAKICGGARGVMVIVVGNGHGDSSSNPGRD